MRMNCKWSDLSHHCVSCAWFKTINKPNERRKIMKESSFLKHDATLQKGCSVNKTWRQRFARNCLHLNGFKCFWAFWKIHDVKCVAGTKFNMRVYKNQWHWWDMTLNIAFVGYCFQFHIFWKKLGKLSLCFPYCCTWTLNFIESGL